MNTSLWVVQSILALAFGLGGLVKAIQPKEKLEPKFPWVADFSAGTVRFIGSVEFLGAVGLILPAVTGIATILTPLAATGLAVIMVLAAGVHVRRKEFPAIGINIVILLLAAFVAWGRFGTYAL